MTALRFVLMASMALALQAGATGEAHADMLELERDTAAQTLASSTGVVLVDVFAFW